MPGNEWPLTLNDESSLMTTVNQMEEDVDSGSQWQQATGKRHRSSPLRKGEKPSKQTKLGDYWLGVPTANKFNDLEVEETTGKSPDGESLTGSKSSEPRPPPIFVYNVEQIQPLTTLLNEIAPQISTLLKFLAIFK